jgi:DNA topoisomerase-3
MTCPKCKQHLLKKGNSAFGCSNFAVCGFKLPFEMAGKKLTEKQVFELLSKGRTSKIKGFIIPGSSVPIDKKLVMDGTFNLGLAD